ncbi:hypothetical protein [uncultured Sphingomonas sp.]|uniref:hypothetical protein n=1 Tax=uncultured Sphingomonas sp. TaxID=158754 RepID=UPI00258FE3B4|nr:hypothetical protein [uncultured Sphingomonas sp.]
MLRWRIPAETAPGIISAPASTPPAFNKWRRDGAASCDHFICSTIPRSIADADSMKGVNNPQPGTLLALPFRTLAVESQRFVARHQNGGGAFP